MLNSRQVLRCCAVFSAIVAFHCTTQFPAALAGEDGFDLRVCNQTGSTASAAFIYQTKSGWEEDKWTYFGWLNLDPGQCQFVDPVANPNVYFYGYNSDGYWEGSHTDCIDENNGYSWRLSDGEGCPSGQWADYIEVTIPDDIDEYTIGLK